jgi:hypothetical protein
VSAKEGLTFEFEEKQLEVKGKEFKLRELTAEKYDECVKLATGPDDDIDMVTLLRLMLLESLQEPKLEADQLGKLPYSVIRQLTTAVNRLHFTDTTAASGNA